MKKSPAIKKGILSAREAAQIINVTAQTIKNYIYSGKLKSIKTPGGHHRIRRSDLENIGFSQQKHQAELGSTREDTFIYYNQLLDAYKNTIEILVKALDSRDIIGAGHSVRVADYSAWMADMLNLSTQEKENVTMAALLHDVGKICIKKDILSKNGKLIPEEIVIIQKHPEMGEKIVKDANYLRPAQTLIRHHHERFDGKGYPDGLRGEKIPLGSRIIFLAETYDFMRSNLPFRPAFSSEETVAEIRKVAGSQFDPDFAKVFVENLERRAFH